MHRMMAHSLSGYRFHQDDPILFPRGLRLTCRCGEELGEEDVPPPADRPVHDL